MKLLLLFITTISLLFSAPAFHGKKSFELENGETFKGYVKGDEHLNWIESESGEILLFNKKNSRYEYAEIRNSELMASGIQKKLHVKKRTAKPLLEKEDLYKLWKKRRNNALSRRKQ